MIPHTDEAELIPALIELLIVTPVQALFRTELMYVYKMYMLHRLNG